MTPLLPVIAGMRSSPTCSPIGGIRVDAPPAHDGTLHDVLQQAFDDARARRRGDRLRKTLQMLWADELLENQRQVQVDLATSADIFARRRQHRSMI